MKRILAVVLAVVMLLPIFSVNVFAVDPTTTIRLNTSLSNNDVVKEIAADGEYTFEWSEDGHENAGQWLVLKCGYDRAEDDTNFPVGTVVELVEFSIDGEDWLPKIIEGKEKITIQDDNRKLVFQFWNDWEQAKDILLEKPQTMSSVKATIKVTLGEEKEDPNPDEIETPVELAIGSFADGSINDGVATPTEGKDRFSVKLPKTVAEGETIKLRMVGECNEPFRFWLAEGWGSRSAITASQPGEFNNIVEFTVSGGSATEIIFGSNPANTNFDSFKLTNLYVIAVPDPDPVEPTSYETAITLVKDGVGLLTGNDFTERASYGGSGYVISASQNVEETKTFLKAFAVPGARMVMKYTISANQGWFNWLQTNLEFGIANWEGGKNGIFKNADGTNHGDTISDGAHVVYVDCAEYVSMYEAETNKNFYNNFSTFGFQSGNTGFYFEELTIEIPEGIDLDEVDIPGRASGTVTFYSTASNAWDTPTIVKTTNGIKNGNWNRLLDITNLVARAAGTALSKVTDIHVTIEALDSESFPSRIGDYWDCVEVRAMVSGSSDPVKLIGSRANKEAITGNVVTMMQYLTYGTEGIFIHLQDYAAIDETTPVTFKVTVAATVSETGPQPLTLQKYDDGTHAEYALYAPYVVMDGYGITLVDEKTNMSIDDFNKAINKPGAKLYIDASYSGWSGNYWFEFILPDGSTKNVVAGSDEVIRDKYNNVLTAADLISLLSAETTVPDDYVVTLKNIKRHAGDTTINRFEVVVPNEAADVLVRSIFGDKIALEYAVMLPADVTTPVMEFTVGGNTFTADGRKDLEGSEIMPFAVDDKPVRWFFTCDGLTPAQIDEVISAKVVGQDIEIPDCSILDYCEERLKNSTSDEFKLLVSELVRYASTAAELDNGAALDISGISTVPSQTSAKYTDRYKRTGGTAWTGATLVLENTIAMRIYYNGDVIPTAASIDCAVHHTVTVHEEKKYVEITGFTPLDYDEEIVATLDGTTVTYSVGSYINRMSENGSDLTQRIVANMQNYGRAAEAYASLTNQD